MTDLEKLQYGKPLVSIDREKPTQIKCFGDVDLICIELDIKRREDIIVKISLGCFRIDTADLKGQPPRDSTETLKRTDYIIGWPAWDFIEDKNQGMTAETAATIGIRVRKLLESSCYDHSDRRVPINSSTFNKHSEHKKCKPRENIILILANKEKTLQDLRLVDFDPDDQCVYFELLNCMILSLMYR